MEPEYWKATAIYIIILCRYLSGQVDRETQLCRIRKSVFFGVAFAWSVHNHF